MKIQYQFSSKIWQYKGAGGWHFVSLPQQLSAEIRETFQSEERAWGRLNATAQIENSKWSTAIWFDTKLNTYLLPLKSEIRKKENISVNEVVMVTVYI